jgi:hypothetical protein
MTTQAGARKAAGVLELAVVRAMAKAVEQAVAEAAAARDAQV